MPRKRKRGRPANGRDPLISVRLPKDLLSYINGRAATYSISRSELFRIMLEETKLGMPPDLMRSRTAYHEAGHAVIARVLNISIIKVSIRFQIAAAGSRTGSAGRVHHYRTKRRHLGLYERDALVMMTLAGRLAEQILIGFETDGGDRKDLADVRRFAKSMNEWRMHRLHRMTEMLVWRHAESIRRVAAHLLNKEELDQPSVDKIIQASPRRVSARDYYAYTFVLDLGKRVRYLY